MEAHAPEIDDLDFTYALLEEFRPRAAVALEREFHVLGRHRIAVVELEALADDEVVGEPVLRLRERLREARRVRSRRHRLHQGVVERVQHHERRDDPLGLGRIEPARGERDVNAPRYRALWRRRRWRDTGDEKKEREKVRHDSASLLKASL